MKKNLLLVLCCLPLLGTTCPIPSIGVTCSNNLDASSFGFTATIPADFQCTTTLPNDRLLVSVRYKQNSTGFIASVIVGPSGAVNTDCGQGATCAEQTPVTTANGVAFRVIKVTSSNPAFVSYLAVATLASGNNLGISVSVLSSTDNGALQTSLNAIMESVVLTP